MAESETVSLLFDDSKCYGEYLYDKLEVTRYIYLTPHDISNIKSKNMLSELEILFKKIINQHFDCILYEHCVTLKIKFLGSSYDNGRFKVNVIESKMYEDMAEQMAIFIHKNICVTNYDIKHKRKIGVGIRIRAKSLKKANGKIVGLIEKFQQL